MQNVTQIFATEEEREYEESSCSFVGALSGFAFYWLAFAIPFLVYGSNTLFFLLYTWPFFLALMPVSVLIGIGLGMVLRGHHWLIIAGSGIAVICLFWLVFSQLTGW